MRQVLANSMLDMHARFAAADDLEQVLTLMAPEQVSDLFESLGRAAVTQAAARKVDLVMQWANFVARASNGIDERGTLDQFGGTIAQQGQHPGTVRIPVTVNIRANTTLGPGIHHRQTPVTYAHLQVGAISMNGMGPDALATLRAADRRLATARVHRIFDVDLIDEHGDLQRIGTLDVTPEGVVDASAASSTLLAAVGRTNPGIWAPAPEILGVTDIYAQKGVKLIVSLPGVTTASIP